MFKITVQDDPSGERWIIEGRLGEDFAHELGEAWKVSTAENPCRRRIVDLRDVIFIDKCGESVLRDMIICNAEFVFAGIYTDHLLKQLRAVVGKKLTSEQSDAG